MHLLHLASRALSGLYRLTCTLPAFDCRPCIHSNQARRRPVNQTTTSTSTSSTNASKTFDDTRDKGLHSAPQLDSPSPDFSLQALSKSLCISLQDAGLDRESDRKRSPRQHHNAHGLPVNRSRHRHRTATLLRDWSPSSGHIPLLSPRLHRAGIWVTRRLSRVCHHYLLPAHRQPSKRSTPYHIQLACWLRFLQTTKTRINNP